MKDIAALAAFVLFIIVLGILVFGLGYKVLSVEFGLLEVQLQPPTTSVPNGIQERRSASVDRPPSQSPEDFIHNYYQLINASSLSERDGSGEFQMMVDISRMLLW